MVAPLPISERGSGYRPRSEETIQPVGAYEHLSFATGLPQSVFRHIRSFPTDMSVADTIIAAVGEPSDFYGLEVRPNPYAPPERQAECCGGSMTGSAFPQSDAA